MKLNACDWVIQKQSNNENTYALITGKTKHGKLMCIAISDFRPIAVKTTLTNWYPEPVKIDKNNVPEKLLYKVLRKAEQ